MSQNNHLIDLGLFENDSSSISQKNICEHLDDLKGLDFSHSPPPSAKKQLDNNAVTNTGKENDMANQRDADFDDFTIENHQRNGNESKSSSISTDDSANTPVQLEKALLRIKELEDLIQKNDHQSNKNVNILKEEKLELKNQLNHITVKLVEIQNEYSNSVSDLDNTREKFLRTQKELQEEKENHLETKKKLENASVSVNKSSMLSMELSDYQRASENLKEQLSKKEIEIENKDSFIDSLKEKLVSAKDADEKIVKLKQLVVRTRQSLKQSTEDRANKDTIIKDLEERLTLENKSSSNTNEEFENCKKELASINDKYSEIQKCSFHNQSELERQIKVLKTDLENEKNEKDEIESEYKKYKTRVHSVLKQQSTTSHTPITSPTPSLDKSIELTRQLEESRNKLQDQINKMNELETIIDKLETKCNLLNEENAYLADSVEKDTKTSDQLKNLQSYATELQETLQMKEKELQDYILNDQQVPATKNNLRFSEDSTKELTNLRIDLENLNEENKNLVKICESLKLKIQSLQTDKDDLQKKMETKEEQHKRMIVKLDKLRNDQINELAFDSGDDTADSKQTEVTSKALANDTLSQLLSFGDEWNENKITTLNSAGLSSATPSPTTLPSGGQETINQLYKEIFDLQKQLEDCQSNLSESEANIDKHQTQQSFLKEEIRKLESQLLANENYNPELMKNILCNFLDAKTPDDRRPLIHVFAKMLQFNATEKTGLLERYSNYESRVSGSWGAYFKR